MSDVKLGHCWYCREPGDKVSCPTCKVGVYCSNNCQERDKRRHTSECQSFGPQKCSYCKTQLANRLECTRCGEAYYCNQSCQKKDWKKHKSDCKELDDRIVNIACNFIEYNTQHNKNAGSHMPDCPFYFGNTLAVDFLNLRQNEWKAPHSADDPCLDTDYCVLSVGCGDLRNLVNTIAQLPEEFHGKLSITMCDFDPFVMARNVLFLYMMVKYADKSDFGKSLASIWYSILLSEQDYNLLIDALKYLCDAEDKSLLELTEGLADMKSDEVAVLRQVWSVWKEMRCRSTGPNHIKLRKQRLQRMATFMDYIPPNPQVPPKHQESHIKWQRDGIISDEKANPDKMIFYNPTLTGRGGWDVNKGCKSDYKGGSQPKDLPFVYCIQGNSEPFHVWDYLEIEKQVGHTDSLPAMFHAYVSNIIARNINFISKEKRLTLKMTTTDCQKLATDCEFDRVFTSNLADYIGVYDLALTFGPMLNPDNSHSVLVMDTLFGLQIWQMMVDESEFARMEKIWKLAAMADNAKNQQDYVPHYTDYIYDAKWFLRLLKSWYVASGLNPEAKAPSSKTVLKLGDLQMRDPRRERNTVVPYFYLKGPRQGAPTTSRLRVLEWYYPDDE